MMVKYRKGQVLLITVLVLSIAVTIALSLIGRSVSDVSMSRNLEESARAFSAAEAGIEEELLTNTLVGRTNTSYTENAGYTSQVAIIGDSTGVYTLPVIPIGQADTVWLVAHNASNGIDFPPSYYYPYSTIDVCWSNTTPVAALEVAIYYKSGTSYLVNRGAYDPDATRRLTNKFSIATISPGCGGMTNAYRQTVSIPNGAGIVPLFMRIRPYYGNATVTISPLNNQKLPKQGVEVSSVGCTQITANGCTEGGVTRKIVVRRQYPGAATAFDYSLYSQGTLEK